MNIAKDLDHIPLNYFIMNDNEVQLCTFMLPVMTEVSTPRSSLVRLSRVIPNKLFTLKGRMVNFYYHRLFPQDKASGSVSHADNLQVGDWVEVLTMAEIAGTLDGRGRYKGLYFMPEMARYCGKRFKVVKKVQNIKLETDGDLRKLKSPSYFLEGVYCDGVMQGGCDRCCFHFWKAEWLRK